MRKRSSYRPKHTANPLAYMTAIQGAHKLCTHDQLTRAMRVHASVEELIGCKGTLQSWADVFDAINFMEAFAHMGVVRHAREWIEVQQESVVQAMDRHKDTGSNVLRPSECDLLRELSTLWAQVLAEVTCREFFEAETRVARRVRQALRGGSQDGVRVVEIA